MFRWQKHLITGSNGESVGKREDPNWFRLDIEVKLGNWMMMYRLFVVHGNIHWTGRSILNASMHDMDLLSSVVVSSDPIQPMQLHFISQRPSLYWTEQSAWQVVAINMFSKSTVSPRFLIFPPSSIAYHSYVYFVHQRMVIRWSSEAKVFSKP